MLPSYGSIENQSIEFDISKLLGFMGTVAAVSKPKLLRVYKKDF